MFLSQTSKYLGPNCDFLEKYFANLALFTIFAVDYYNDVTTNMRKTYSYKLTSLAVFCMYSATASAQQENMDTLFDLPHMMAYLVAGLMITVFVMLFYNRLYYYRQKEMRTESERLNAQLALIMTSNKTQLWTFDKAKNMFKTFSHQGDRDDMLLPIDFSQPYEREDFSELRQRIAGILKGETLSDSLYVRGIAPKTAGEVQRVYEVNLSILHRDHRNKPTMLLGIQKDITDNKAKTEKAKRLMLRFHTVFNSSLVDMLYYDADGYLTDINEKACETFGISCREEALAKHTHINQIPPFHNINFKETEHLQTTTMASTKELKEEGLIPEDVPDSTFYYEAAVSTIRDKDGQLLGIFTAGRNVTDMVESNHHQKESTRRLAEATHNIESYIQNINYSLKVSDVRLMNYSPDTHTLEISSDLSTTQYQLPQLRAITMVKESDRRKAKGLFRRMDRRHPGIINDTLCTQMRDSQGRDVFLNFSVMPITGPDGTVSHYFGMCRNVTEMTYTEIKLREETEKAQETEQLKNTFLLNMSYELRTPLSAVVGFAELFNGEHSAEDEPVFAEQIKKNTGELLKLINDILFISRLDARMIEFNYQETDFATLFEGWCYMGWSTLSPSVKAVVENSYSRLLARIDTQNLGMVIEKICTFSGSMVTEGAVRAKYEYRHGELMITIEDTGRGISKNDLPHVFERFVRNEQNEHFGTGVDLPIVQELIEQMGGTIEVQSEEGKGCSFYLSIPCESSSIERKTEIVV